MASIIERIDLGCASNLECVLISLTAARYDSYCAISLPSDFFSNLTIISLSKAVEFNFVVLF